MGGSQSKPDQQNASVAPALAPAQENAEVGSSSMHSSKDAGCPMKKSDGGYTYDWKALFTFSKGKHPPLNKSAATNEKSQIVHQPASSEEGGCPVKHNPEAPTATNTPEGGCPVQVKSGKENQQYNVYSQPIDPKNNMPNLNQLPAPGQNEELPTKRVKSTILKGGTEDGSTWTYPSPQMFYNALARKGKLGETEESDIESVVALHNNMNEKTWNKVLEWEDVLRPTATAPKLLKFLGRPSDLSPKAQFKHWFLGHPLPFDRHDWTILREDGTQVRYVIDYYSDETQASEADGSGTPDMHDFEATPSLLVDVRPALDGPTELLDRCVRMPYAKRVAGISKFEPMSMFPTKDMKTQVKDSLLVWENIQQAAKEKLSGVLENEEEIQDVSENEAVVLAQSFSNILKNCREAQQMVDDCESEQEFAKASMALTICMAKVVCPLQHGALVKTLTDDDDSLVDAALENVSSCVTGANQRTIMAKRNHPSAFSGLSKQ